MFHDQQYRILLSKGIARPNPREQFLDDLITQVGQWRQSRKVVLICLDANEDVTSTTNMQGLARILAETNLVDLHHLRHPTTPRPLRTTAATVLSIPALDLLNLHLPWSLPLYCPSASRPYLPAITVRFYWISTAIFYLAMPPPQPNLLTTKVFTATAFQR